MIHTFLLVYFAHNIALGGSKTQIDDEITLGVYKNMAQCELVLREIQHYKQEVSCMAIDFDAHANKQSFKMKWWF